LKVSFAWVMARLVLTRPGVLRASVRQLRQLRQLGERGEPRVTKGLSKGGQAR